MQWWFKKFFKREESLEDEDHSDQPSELDNDQLRAINGVELLITTWEVAKEKCRPFYGHWHLKQTGKVKKLNRWVPHELTKNQKNHHFEALSFLTLHNKEQFLNWIGTCDKKWILYNNWWWPAQWLDQEEAPKHFLKAKIEPKKERSWSLFGGLLPIWPTTAFWILAKSLHLRSTLSELIRCPQNCCL